MSVVTADPKTSELFANGNYTVAARDGDLDAWQTWAARGVCGLKDAALAGLERFAEPEARFYEAVTHWIDGDDDSAARILETFRDSDAPCAQHARNLLAMVRKPQLHVLAQFPWTRRAPFDLLTKGQSDGRFHIDNISFHPDDLANMPQADVHRYYDRANPPDFYTCMMTEWHVLPPNLHELPCPTIGQSSDYDAHIQCVYPWFNVYDEMLATDPTEWLELGRMSRKPVTTFPKVFGIDDNLPPVPACERDIDIFFSGTVLPFVPPRQGPPHAPDSAHARPERALHQRVRGGCGVQHAHGPLQDILHLCAPARGPCPRAASRRSAWGARWWCRKAV